MLKENTPDGKRLHSFVNNLFFFGFLQVGIYLIKKGVGGSQRSQREAPFK